MGTKYLETVEKRWTVIDKMQPSVPNIDNINSSLFHIVLRYIIFRVISTLKKNYPFFLSRTSFYKLPDL